MMGRPLLLTDCDEVLLHMVAHFQDWLGEAHAIDFAFETGDFAGALTHRDSGALVDEDRVWPLLTDFFRGEMHRQTLVPGALEALGRIGEVADIVILTNLGDEAHGWRVEQLAAHGIAMRSSATRAARAFPPARSSIGTERRAPSSSTIWRFIMPRWRSMRPRSGGCIWSPSRGWPGGADRQACPCADRRLADRLRMGPRSPARR